ncbi:serine hydrolase domain-containing protein [Microbacterium chocolatum]|uniref:serine hydrolase domain-containing protein n=1 Tax=Microbacterium aurantiacum TaxID=162393 RepID=UPI00338F49DE
MTDPSPSVRDAVARAADYIATWWAFQGAQRAVPGIQAAIRLRGELVLDFAWGVSDVETGAPVTSESLFRIASHSKTFTATAVMQLVEDGALRLDDPVVQWIPELADTPLSAVSVRELLGHQAGVIRDGVDADYWQRGADFPDRERLLRICREEGRIAGANEYFKYSNIGYSLLGLVIEAASGRSYRDYTDQRIVAPLGLTRTGAEWDAARADDYAAGHTGLIAADDRRRRITHVDTRAMAAATGWYSTAAEVSDYLSAHAEGDTRLLSDASKRLLHRRESTVPIGEITRHYGLGFELREIDGHDLVGHSGGYPGHITRTWLDPETGIVVSVLTNAIDGPADTLATGALRLLRAAVDTADADARIADITGRYASLWSVLDLVDLGGQTVGLYPGSPDPAGLVEPITATDGILRLEAKPGFGAVGEEVRVARDDAGLVESIVWSGMTMWPIDRFRAALQTAQPGDVLERMSL